jgi:hypothetical protein
MTTHDYYNVIACRVVNLNCARGFEDCCYVVDDLSRASSCTIKLISFLGRHL